MAEQFNRQVSESEASVLNSALDDTELRSALLERILTLDALSPDMKEKVGVHVSGFLLAGAAGLINAVAFARYLTYVSHVSGSATSVGLRANGDQPGDVPTPALLIVDFIIGSIICGMFIPKATLKLGKAPYTSALLLLSVITTLGWLCASKHYDPEASATQFLGPHWLALACGLQNGLCSAWSGNVLRTTHVTGTATDLGLAVGRMNVRFFKKGMSTSNYESADWDDHVVDRQKFVIMTVLLVGFTAGAFLGAEMFNVVGLHTLLLAAGLQAGLGIAHYVYVMKTQEEIVASAEAEAGFKRQLSPNDKDKAQAKAGESYTPMLPQGARGA